MLAHIQRSNNQIDPLRVPTLQVIGCTRLRAPGRQTRPVFRYAGQTFPTQRALGQPLAQYGPGG